MRSVSYITVVGVLCGYRHNLPYADILEMPINFWQNPVPGVTPDTGNNYRHLFQSAQALYNILIVSIFESDIILKDRTITIA